ncbi:MAG TPA: FtsX-like permease family protein, partial [Alphaproteobacteria bacterium]|nr:FtsX-like permease family protein [Alphaproteobacteria bacterium]
ATLSAGVEMHAMARAPDGTSTLVELKAVDAPYPLYGALTLEGGGDARDAMSRRDGTWGAIVEDSVLDRLGAGIGDRVAVGEETFEIRGVIAREPDRAGGGFALGPRLMIDAAALSGTGLQQPGSMVYYQYRLALPEGTAVDGFVRQLEAAFPEAGWRTRTFDEAAPRLAEMIDRLTLFLTLVGLTALLVGGVGVGNAVKAFLDGKTATIATLKCLGASGGLVFGTYLAQILWLAAGGIVLGLVVGAAALPLVDVALAGVLPIDVRVGVYPGALLLAAGFGLLTALTFSLWPLARARDVPAAALFRDLVAPSGGRPRPVFVAATGLCALTLAGLAVLSAQDKVFALWFVLGAATTIAAFRFAAWAVIAGARRLRRPRRPGLRLALANLHRPGAPTAGVVLSLGLGLTVLVAIALIEGNMARQIRDDLPRDAPSFFFIDIQPDQVERFNAIVASTDGVSDLEEVPSLRGRIVAVNGRPAADALLDPGESWLIRGDRGVTYRAEKRPSDTLPAGEWWPSDYAGPPLISIYEDIGRAFGIGIGDTITVNVVGGDITAEVANLRAIDWESLSINFTMIFSPEPLSAAPHTYLATVRATDEAVLQRAVTAAFPNVTAVNVGDALDTVNDLLLKIGTAVRTTAGVTLVAGTLVLAGAIAAGHRRRVYDSVVLKVLGATRADVLRAFLVEYGLMGLITAALAAMVGTVAAWAVLTQVMEADWVFLPSVVLATALVATAVTVGFGFVGTWRALGQKAAPVLRND